MRRSASSTRTNPPSPAPAPAPTHNPSMYLLVASQSKILVGRGTRRFSWPLLMLSIFAKADEESVGDRSKYLNSSRQDLIFLQPALAFDEAYDLIDALPAAQIAEHERARAAHALGIALHD